MTSELFAIDPERDPVDILADEFATRYRRGETPSITEYVQRYPEHAEQIQSLFPSVALLEQLGSRPDSDGRRERQGSLPPHHRIGDFEILREIGRGGMGVVYEAVQQSLHRPVALKVLNTAALHSANQVKRFEREAQAAAQLHHTNIVPVFGVGEQDGLRYYVMQRIHGLGLDAVLAELSRQGRSTGGKGDRPRDDGERSVSAQTLAGVLISGELSRSSSGIASHDRASSGSWNNTFNRAMDNAPRRNDATGRSQSAAQLSDVPPTEAAMSRPAMVDPVPSSLVLRDDSTLHGGVRSSLILRDDISGAYTFRDGPPDGDSFLSEPNPEPDRSPATRSHSFGRRYWRNIARIGVQIASGLHYAHSQGTLHRDIKPANILLDTDGRAWIADFGLAKVLEADNVTHTGDVVGTLRYMAPEQFQGAAHARSDIYSLGLTLYELLTLRPAYDETDRQKLIARKLTPHDPPPIRKWAPDVPRDLETIVHKCLAYEAKDRYASAGALLADLQAFVDDRPIQARQSTSIERFWRWCRRNPAVASLSGTVALLLLLTAGLTTAGYVQQKQRAAEERALHAAADDAREKAIEEREKAERIAEIAFAAFDSIGQSFVSNDVIGTIEFDEDDADHRIQVPAYSPDTAAIMEKLRSSFDELAKIAGEDRRFLDYAANADLRAGELHLRLNQWKQARAAFSRAIGLYEEFDDEPQDAEARLRLAKLYNGLGVAYAYLREPDPMRDAQQRALSLLSDSAAPDMQFERARTYYLMGCRFRGAPPADGPRGRGERERSDDARDAAPRWASASPGPPPPPAAVFARSGRDGAPSYEEGGRSRRHGAWRFDRERREQEDRAHLEQAAALFAELVRKHPSVSHYQYWQALCYLELARQSPQSHDDDDGRERAVAILEALVAQQPHQADYLYQLSEAYELSYHQLMRGRGWGPRWSDDDQPDPTPEQLEDVEQDLRKAVQVSNRLLVQQPHVPGYAISNFFLLIHLVDVLREQEDYRGALEVWDQLPQARLAIADHFPDLRHFAGRSESGVDPVREFFRAHVLVSEGQLEEACETLESIIDQFEEFSRTTPGPRARYWRTNRELASVYRLLESCLTELGRHEEAAAIRERREELTRDDNHRIGNPRPAPDETDE